MKLEGMVTISRVGNIAGQGFIEISIEDKKSGIEFVRARISYMEFTQAVTGLGSRPAFLELRGLENVGNKYEYKSMAVFVPEHDMQNQDAVTKKAVTEVEIDGWIGSVSDAQNHHKLASKTDDGAFYNVGFQRWVKEDPK